MKKIILLLLIFKIYSYIKYKTYEINDFVQKINNKIKYNESDYNMIITSIMNALEKYYVYLDITPHVDTNFGKVDLIQELKKMQLKKYTSYLDFL